MVSRSHWASTHPGIDTKRLSRRLKGDLDWIVMKALEKDRERRYETASDFAKDIRRFLNFEAVLASPPSSIYRLKRTLWRYRVVVAVTLTMLSLSLLGTAGTAYGLFKSQRANRDLAKSLENEARERTEAQRQQEIAEAVIAFLNDDLLAAVAPSVEPGKGRDVLMREVLDTAAERIETAAQVGGRFFDKPQVESRIRLVVGETYLALNLPQQAQTQLTRAHLLSSQLVDNQYNNQLEVDILTAQARTYAELGKLTEAEDMAKRIVEMNLAEHDSDSKPVIMAKHIQATIFFRVGKFAESRVLFDECLRYYRKTSGENSNDVLRTQAVLASCYVKMNEHSIAEELYTALMPKARATKDSFVLLKVLGDLAEMRTNQQRFDEAQVLNDEAMALTDKIHGADHSESLSLVGQSAILAAKRQDWPKALERFHRVYDFQVKASGLVGISTVSARHNLAVAYFKINEIDKAETLIKDQLNEATSALGNDNLWIRRTYNFIGLIGDTYQQQGRPDDALRMHRLVQAHVLALVEAAGPTPADLHRTAVFFADTTHSEIRNLPKALEYIERAVTLKIASQEARTETFDKDLERIRKLNQSASGNQ